MKPLSQVIVISWSLSEGSLGSAALASALSLPCRPATAVVLDCSVEAVCGSAAVSFGSLLDVFDQRISSIKISS